MSNTDQESLLNTTDRLRHNPVRGFRVGSRWINKIILSAILILFLLCSIIYIYLNMEVVDTSQSQPNKFKPLSRRKPMLDHESIFSDSGPSMLRVTDLLAHCIVALKVAGQEVVNLSLRNNDRLDQIGSKGKTLEGVEDVVTGADMRSHHFITNTIKDSYRRLRIVSEEDNTNEFENRRLEEDLLPVNRTLFAEMIRSELDAIEGTKHLERTSLIAQNEILIWIDPLDATKEYSENLTQYVTLMACIVYKSTPIAGVIYKPFTKQTYWSLRDTSTNESHLSEDLRKAHRRFNSPSDNHPMKMIISRSHAGLVEEVLRKLYGPDAKIIQAGGSGYKTIRVIEGQADAYVHMTHIKKWDICAPHAIINSLKGGALTTLKGNLIDFGNPKETVVTEGLIASLRPDLHRRLVVALQSDDSQE